jgi:hypothetical protein
MHHTKTDIVRLQSSKPAAAAAHPLLTHTYTEHWTKYVKGGPSSISLCVCRKQAQSRHTHTHPASDLIFSQPACDERWSTTQKQDESAAAAACNGDTLFSNNKATLAGCILICIYTSHALSHSYPLLLLPCLLSHKNSSSSLLRPPTLPPVPGGSLPPPSPSLPSHSSSDLQQLAQGRNGASTTTTTLPTLKHPTTVDSPPRPGQR